MMEVKLKRCFSVITARGRYALVLNILEGGRELYILAESTLTYIPSIRSISEAEYTEYASSGLVLVDDKYLDYESFSILYKYIYYTSYGLVDKSVYFRLYGESAYSSMVGLEDELSDLWKCFEGSMVSYLDAYISIYPELCVRVTYGEYLAYKSLRRIILNDEALYTELIECGVTDSVKDAYLGCSTEFELYYVLELLEDQGSTGLYTREILRLLHK